jgi:hypothetical protein
VTAVALTAAAGCPRVVTICCNPSTSACMGWGTAVAALQGTDTTILHFKSDMVLVDASDQPEVSDQVRRKKGAIIVERRTCSRHDDGDRSSNSVVRRRRWSRGRWRQCVSAAPTTSDPTATS